MLRLRPLYSYKYVAMTVIKVAKHVYLKQTEYHSFKSGAKGWDNLYSRAARMYANCRASPPLPDMGYTQTDTQ